MPTLTTKRIIMSTAPLAFDRYKHNIVMGFSYYKLFTDYSGYCVKVRRNIDNKIQDFGFVNGYIDYESIVSFCSAGGTGFVHTWYNQFIGGNDAIQIANGNQPAIFNGGVFNSDGFLFDVNNKNMQINGYSAMQSDSISVCMGVKQIPNATIGTMFSYETGTTSVSQDGFIIFKENRANSPKLMTYWGSNGGPWVTKISTNIITDNTNVLLSVKNINNNVMDYTNVNGVDEGNVSYYKSTSNVKIGNGLNAWTTLPFNGNIKSLIMFNCDVDIANLYNNYGAYLI